MNGSEYDRLLRAVVEEPGEDIHRLILADWLEEYGDDRGRARSELIRLQIGMEEFRGEQCAQCTAAHRGGQRTNGPCRCGPRWKKFCGMETKLLNAHTVTDLPPFVVNWEYRRGLVNKVWLPLDQYLRSMEWLFAEHPITEVQITDRSPRATDCGYEWIRGQWIRGQTDPMNITPASYTLPVALYVQMLEKYLQLEDRGVIPFMDMVYAHKALSWTCVQYARKRAGLKPIDW